MFDGVPLGCSFGPALNASYSVASCLLFNAGVSDSSSSVTMTPLSYPDSSVVAYISLEARGFLTQFSLSVCDNDALRRRIPSILRCISLDGSFVHFCRTVLLVAAHV
jgi:hypothetical protein